MSQQCDCLIVGGGIAGLWLLRCLREAGIDAWLLEKDALGSGQTLSSQGIIHGGIKYSLGGSITGSTKAIASMPDRWRAHLKGQHVPGLRDVEVLANNQYMLISGNIPGRLISMMASQSLVSHSSTVNLDALQLTQEMTGLLVDEDIVNTRSLVQSLHSSVGQYCLKYEVQKEDISCNGAWSLQISGQKITPKLLIFAAGEGNAICIGKGKQQLRPLHMVYVRHPDLFPFYTHILEPGNRKPLCTISSHYDEKGVLLWYIGGDIAETGTELFSSQQCIRVERLLRNLWTNIDWGHGRWGSFLIQRAEYKNRWLLRPELPVITRCGENSIAVFPTKLTFAPLLADMVMEQYRHLFSNHPRNITVCNEPLSTLSRLPKAEVGSQPWK